MEATGAMNSAIPQIAHDAKPANPRRETIISSLLGSGSSAPYGLRWIVSVLRFGRQVRSIVLRVAVLGREIGGEALAAGIEGGGDEMGAGVEAGADGRLHRCVRRGGAVLESRVGHLGQPAVLDFDVLGADRAFE